MIRIKYILTIIIYLTLWMQLLGQQDSLYTLRSDVHIGVTYARSTGAYKDFSADNDAVGVRFDYLYQPLRDIPLMAGLDISFMFINSRKSEFITQDEFGDDFLVRDRWSNNRFSVTFKINYRFFKWKRFVPFVEAGVGGHWITTLSNWVDLDGNRVFDPITVETDGSWLTYFAGGVEYELNPHSGLYFRLDRTWSGSIDYFALRATKTDSEFNDRHFEYLESSLDLITFELGYLYRF